MRRNSIKTTSCYAFIVVAVLMRSMIAPGYMIGSQNADGFSWNIILCNGFNGVNAISGLEQASENPHGHHQNHHGHSDDGGSNDHDSHEEDHFTAACGLWSASTSFIAIDISHVNQFPVWEDVYSIDFSEVIKPKTILSQRQARAPPFYSWQLI